MQRHNGVVISTSRVVVLGVWSVDGNGAKSAASQDLLGLGHFDLELRVDRLGDRLRVIGATPKDLDDLENYRHTFEPAYQYMVVVARRIVAGVNDQDPLETAEHWPSTGRFPKANSSVIGKLQRLRTRLSTMQDIAGIRIVVPRRFDQDLAVSWLEAQFPDATKYDRLSEPSHGYRADDAFKVFPVGLSARADTPPAATEEPFKRRSRVWLGGRLSCVIS
jgi:hypothetical protein